MLNIRSIKQLRYNEVCCLFCHFTPYIIRIYHSVTLPAIPKSIVALTTPNALNTFLIVGIVML